MKSLEILFVFLVIVAPCLYEVSSFQLSPSLFWSLRSWMSSSPIMERRCECKKKCKKEDKVQLMAIEKEVKVPKIKIHDFGKKEDWELYNKIDGLDITSRYGGMKYIMRTKSSEGGGYGRYGGEGAESADSGWEVAGKYDFESANWDTGGGNPGFDGISFNE